MLSCYSLNIHFNLKLCWFHISRFSVKRLVLQHFDFRHTNSYNQNDKCITCVNLFQVTVIHVFRIIYLNFIGQIKLYKLFYAIFFSMQCNLFNVCISFCDVLLLLSENIYIKIHVTVYFMLILVSL